MTVEFRSVDARVTSFAANCHPATAAHARAVHHKRVHADYGFYAVCAGKFGHRTHHRHRAYRHYAIGFAFFEDFLENVGHEAFYAVTAVVGRDSDVFRGGAEFVLVHYKFLVPRSHDNGRGVAERGKMLGLRINYRAADTAAYEYDIFIFG